MIKSTKQIILYQQIKIKTSRSSQEKNSKTITNFLEVKLVEFEIDRARYNIYFSIVLKFRENLQFFFN